MSTNLSCIGRTAGGTGPGGAPRRQQGVRSPARQEEHLHIVPPEPAVGGRSEALEDAMPGPVQASRVCDEAGHEPAVANFDQHIVAAILVADLVYDLRLQLGLVTGRVERADEGCRVGG